MEEGGRRESEEDVMRKNGQRCNVAGFRGGRKKPLEAGKRKETDSSLELQEGKKPQFGERACDCS